MTSIFFVQCIIKQLLDSVFVISRIIKVSVRLSAEQNDSQSEEINVVDESQAKSRPVPGQDAEIRSKGVSLVGHYVCCA